MSLLYRKQLKSFWSNLSLGTYTYFQVVFLKCAVFLKIFVWISFWLLIPDLVQAVLRSVSYCSENQCIVGLFSVLSFQSVCAWGNFIGVLIPNMVSVFLLNALQTNI